MNKNALEMMNDMDDEMIFSAMETPKAKEKILSFKKLRWTAVAAALALIVAVTVVAASPGFTVKHQESGFWDVYNENIRFSLEEFSPEILEKTEGTYSALLFSEKSSAEKFIGIKIPENKALDPNNLIEIYDYDENGNPTKSGTHRVGFGIGLEQNELIRVLVFSYYKTAGRYETIEYSYITEKMPYENAGFAWHDDDEFTESYTPKSYVAADGRECVLVKQEHKGSEESYQNCGYIGMTIVDRVFIKVDVRCGSFDKAYDRVTEILDNFQ